MSLRVFSQVFPLAKAQAYYKLLNPLKTSTFTLSRNFCFNIHHLQAFKRNEDLSKLHYNGYYSLIYSRPQIKFYSSKQNEISNDSSAKSEEPDNSSGPKSPEKKISLFQRMKILYKDYWYILVPVHVVTSIIWLGSFYYLAKSGVDVVALMKSIGFSENITEKLKNGNPAYTNIALSYALYKIATPVRYTVTLGATTFSINKLKELGYIKPIPPKEKLVEMYEEKKEQLIETKELLKEKIQDNKALIQERYQDNKAYIQEKYSPEKCKKQLRARRDKLLNSWDRTDSRQNSHEFREPGKSHGKSHRKPDETGTDVKKKEELDKR